MMTWLSLATYITFIAAVRSIDILNHATWEVLLIDTKLLRVR